MVSAFESGIYPPPPASNFLLSSPAAVPPVLPRLATAGIRLQLLPSSWQLPAALAEQSTCKRAVVCRRGFAAARRTRTPGQSTRCCSCYRSRLGAGLEVPGHASLIPSTGRGTSFKRGAPEGRERSLSSKLNARGHDGEASLLQARNIRFRNGEGRGSRLRGRLGDGRRYSPARQGQCPSCVLQRH